MDLYKAAYVCVCFLLSKKNIRQTSFIQLIIKESHFKISCATAHVSQFPALENLVIAIAI